MKARVSAALCRGTTPGGATPGAGPYLSLLTGKQVQSLIGERLRNAEIAETLCTSRRTLGTHVRRTDAKPCG